MTQSETDYQEYFEEIRRECREDEIKEECERQNEIMESETGLNQ